MNEIERLNKSNKIIIKLNKEISKYEQCLDEIEGVANAIVNGTHFTTDIEEHFKELTKRILQLIKQVKEDE